MFLTPQQTHSFLFWSSPIHQHVLMIASVAVAQLRLLFHVCIAPQMPGHYIIRTLAFCPYLTI